MVLGLILRETRVVWVVGEEDVRSVVVVVVWSVCGVERLSVGRGEVGLRDSGLVALGACVRQWKVGLVLIYIYAYRFLEDTAEAFVEGTLRSVNQRL